MALHGTDSREVSYETDRLKFVGRGNTLSSPAAMNWSADGTQALSDTEGSVLDPIVSIRRPIKLSAGRIGDDGYRFRHRRNPREGARPC